MIWNLGFHHQIHDISIIYPNSMEIGFPDYFHSKDFEK